MRGWYLNVVVCGSDNISITYIKYVTGYSVNIKVYCGKENTRDGKGNSHTVFVK